MNTVLVLLALVGVFGIGCGVGASYVAIRWSSQWGKDLRARLEREERARHNL